VRTLKTSTCWARIYIAGPIDVAKQVIRQDCLRQGLCVTIEPTTYIYSGGEEEGYVVGLNNYPRFPMTEHEIEERAKDLAMKLLEGTFQHSVMLQFEGHTIWYTKREQA